MRKTHATCCWSYALHDGLAIAYGNSGLSHVGINIWKNIDTANVVDLLNTGHLASAIVSHVSKLVNDELEGSIRKRGVGSLDILVVGHELIQNSLACKLVNLTGY
jgi:hypothetical protein